MRDLLVHTPQPYSLGHLRRRSIFVPLDPVTHVRSSVFGERQIAESSSIKRLDCLTYHYFPRPKFLLLDSWRELQRQPQNKIKLTFGMPFSSLLMRMCGLFIRVTKLRQFVSDRNVIMLFKCLLRLLLYHPQMIFAGLLNTDFKLLRRDFKMFS